MDIDGIYKAVGAARGFFIQTVAGLSDEQLTKIPEGSKNNILWNIGHICHTNCSIIYGNSGQPLPLPDSYKDLFKGGSSPGDWSEPPSISEVMGHLESLTDQIYADYEAGKFDNFKGFTIFKGYDIDTVEDALAFNVLHESLHVGLVMALKKQVA